MKKIGRTKPRKLTLVQEHRRQKKQLKAKARSDVPPVIRLGVVKKSTLPKPQEMSHLYVENVKRGSVFQGLINYTKKLFRYFRYK